MFLFDLLFAFFNPSGVPVERALGSLDWRGTRWEWNVNMLSAFERCRMNRRH